MLRFEPKSLLFFRFRGIKQTQVCVMEQIILRRQYTSSELPVRWSNSFRNPLPPHLSDVSIGGLCLKISVTFRNRHSDISTHFTP